MNLPRLIIADEIRADVLPASLAFVYAMKRAGLKVKVFTSARSELDVRLLKLLLDEPVISLDTYTCGSIKNLKTLFQLTADPAALNVILVPLGERMDEDFIQVRPDALELAKALGCGVIPIFSAATSAVLTSNIAAAAMATFEEEGENYIQSVIFTSVKNSREYQLLEQDYGRRTPILSLGYIPKEMEKGLPALQDLYNSATGSRVLQLKSAAMQLASTFNQIEWQIIEAIGYLKQDWTAPQEMKFLSKRFKVALVGEKLFSLESSNSAELFRLLGCETVDYDPWNDSFPTEAEAIYFPHSMIGLHGDRLLAHEPFVKGIKQSLLSNKLIFANGASAPLFGRYFTSFEGQKHDALGVFPFHGGYASLKTANNVKKVEIRCTTDTIFSKFDEKMRGYALDYVHISNPANLVPPVWAYRDIRKDIELGNSGWVKGYCFITDLNLELWSNIDVINRWLSLRKR